MLELVKSGQRKSESLDRERYEQQREGYREHLAEERDKRRRHAEKESVGADGAAEPPEAPQKADGLPATDVRTTKSPEERIARLVREGMSRRWAEAEVLGANWPCRRGRTYQERTVLVPLFAQNFPSTSP